MSRRGRGVGGDRKINLNASAPKSTKPPFIPGPPLRPQRKLFVGLLIGFAAWVAVLLTLYFTTIYPRHAPGDLRPPEAGESNAS
ncbi:MAG TPA: hypothetical protein VGR35_20935 [Tepidisphaeraceae bacterium]|nr:hypothetical protein [Tepidisphaeraceae bacterium]